MKRFSELCQRLESVPFHRSKAELLSDYLSQAPERDASWALFLLLGGQLPAVLTVAELREWVLAETKLPNWLMDQAQSNAADFAEAAALVAELLPPDAPEPAHPPLCLAQWIEHHLIPLAQSPPAAWRQNLKTWWSHHPVAECWAIHCLLLGRFPVHLPRRTVEDALLAHEGEGAVARLRQRLAALPLPAAPPLHTSHPSPTQLDLFR